MKVILFELNEVPWSVVDRFVAHRPASALAHLLARGRQSTTVIHESVSLSPWRTWPSLHNSMLAEDHNSYELGQDPGTFRGTPIWEVATRAGKRVGLFGPLQSWPAKDYGDGGFYVPDTFATDASTIPSSVSAFQRFNLRMTSENAFASDSSFSMPAALRGAINALTHGLRPRSAIVLARHLAREQRDSRHKAGRSMMQVVPSFDIYWRLHKRTEPDLSIFFTNHVASMMHRYWGDAMSGYAEEFDYQPDPVFGSFLDTAMSLTDDCLARVLQYVDARPDTVLVIASSMGQGPVQHRIESGDLLYLFDPSKLADALGLTGAMNRLTMHPKCAIDFPTEQEARRAAAVVQTVAGLDDDPVFEDVSQEGSSILFNTTYRRVAPGQARQVRITSADGTESVKDYDSVGLRARPRLGGDNTAYHVPEGMLLSYGASIAASDERQVVDVLDVAPTILKELLRLEPSADMRGVSQETLFGSLAA